MRDVSLTTVKGGLNRLRTKGAAVQDSLYDLLNGYVTTEKTVRVRPGTVLEETLTTGTKGLVAFDGGFHVFASSTVAGLPSNYTLHILRAPDNAALSRIHFAEPFLGFLYVSAEFADGDIYHFWLRTADDWAASTMHITDALVQPTTPNGFLFRATRAEPVNPVWAAGISRAVNDKAEPTEANDYYFEVVSVTGSNPISGTVEPEWDEPEEGQLFLENSDVGSTTPTPFIPPEIPNRRPPGTVEERYGRRRSIP